MKYLALFFIGGGLILAMQYASSPKLQKQVSYEFEYLYNADSTEINHLIEMRKDDKDTTLYR